MRAKKKLLRVSFPNGKVICYNNATSTMTAVLAEIGSDKFPSINLELCHLPLLSKEVYPQYKKWMKPVCDGWYMNAQSSTDGKYIQLRAISDQLSLGLTIELGSEFEPQDDPYKTKKSRVKDNLLVKLPDGEFIANSSATETFLETIWKLGIDDVMRKHLTWCGRDLITTSKASNTQVQIGENRWIVVPSMTKEKAKLLRVIGIMLHLKLEVYVI